MTVRVTSVPRPAAPNSGYHPMLFAARHGDHVWAIPGPGPYAGAYSNIHFFWCDCAKTKKLIPNKILRMLTLFAVFVRALFIRRQVFFVHSFIFAFPLWVSGREFILIIHGTDAKYLQTAFGGFLARRAKAIYGVGFAQQGEGFTVEEVPNVFNLSALNSAKKAEDGAYDVLFVLRPAAVKNPKYPYELYEHLSPDANLKIGVVGLDAEFLTLAQRTKLEQPLSGRSRIEYLGRCSFGKVASLMKSSRVLIIPSHSEGVAKAMLEAFACRLHVIVSDRLTAPEIFDNYLTRVDLRDWALVEKLIDRCIAQGPCDRNARFAERYLQSSIAHLDQLYGSLADITNERKVVRG